MKRVSLSADVEHLQLDDVAHLIADCLNPEGPNDPEGIFHALDKIQAENEVHQAVKDGSLTALHPGTGGPFPMELGLKRAVVLVPDVVAYLAKRGMAVVIEPAGHEVATPAPMVAESPEQRRARYLVWFDDEERIAKRGAKQRVYERVLFENPKADRSNVSKEIEKARAERDDRKRAGSGWGTQLVKGGKR